MARSRTRPISEQEKQLLEEAAELVNAFQKRVTLWLESDWEALIEQTKEAGLYIGNRKK